MKRSPVNVKQGPVNIKKKIRKKIFKKNALYAKKY